MSTKPRDRILVTATRLFLKNGIQAVGINRIIAESDVAPMTLYRQFGGKDELITEALEQWSTCWRHWLADRLDHCGDDPMARFAGLWEALEDWSATEDFRGSFVANVATELRGRPEHPAHKVITAHHMAVRQLLEDLVKLVGAKDPVGLAAQLHVIVEGAMSVAVTNPRPLFATSARALANVALDANMAA